MSPNDFPEMTAKLRFAEEFLDPEFLRACKIPTCDAFVRTLGSLKVQLLNELKSKGAEWRFSYSDHLYMASLRHIGERRNYSDDHYLLELREYRKGGSPLVLSLVISIELLEASATDARFLLGIGNSTTGLIMPLVKVIAENTIAEDTRTISVSTLEKKPEFLKFVDSTGYGGPISQQGVKRSEHSLSHIFEQYDSELEATDIFIQEIENSNPTMSMFDNNPDERTLYFSVFGAFVDQVQAVLIEQLEARRTGSPNEKFDSQFPDNVKDPYTNEKTKVARSTAPKDLEKETQQQPPTSGEKENSKPQRQQAEGLGAASPLSSNLNISDIFEGAIDRQFVSRLMKKIRGKTPQRKFAEQVGLTASLVGRIEACEVPLERSLIVLRESCGVDVLPSVIQSNTLE